MGTRRHTKVSTLYVSTSIEAYYISVIQHSEALLQSVMECYSWEWAGVNLGPKMPT